MLDAVSKVARFVAKERIFPRPTSVLLGVSGGADSVAALLILLELRERFGLELTVAHFDHKLRPGSGEDLEFVRQLCGTLGVPFLSGEGEAADAARTRRRGVEEAARMMRYQFLSFVAGERRIEAIATGHTADDQVETVLMRIIRGSGVRGIRGMLPSGPAPEGPQRLVRPILCLAREETRAVCAAHGIEPRIDPSNQETKYFRSRVREFVLPTLEAENPSLRRSLLGLATSARTVFAGVEREAMGIQPISRGPEGSVFELKRVAALQPEALVLVIEREATFGRLVAEVNRTRMANLGDVLRRGNGIVRFGATEVEASTGKVRIGPALSPLPLEPRVLDVPGVTRAGAYRVVISTSEPAPGAGLVAALDADSLRGALRVRPLRPGDVMVRGGRARAMKDLLGEAAVPSWERASAVAIADGERCHLVFSGQGVVGGVETGERLWVTLTSVPTSAPPG